MTEESKLFCEFIYCHCGCGFTRSLIDKLGRKRKYIWPHQNRGRDRTDMIGENNPNYKGGSDTKAGYRVIYKNKARIFEHRHLMEKHLSRKLERHEVIHHVNKNPKDNRIENLKLTTQPEHIKIHFTKDMTDRFCLLCKSKTTYKKKWSKYKDGFICNKCYMKKWRGEIIF